ncbi:TPA: kfiB protein, partial [Escherichia coli]|nr:kfiB protein [Escherichia coli]
QAYANLPYIETSKDNVSAEAALWEVVEERNSIFNIVSHLVQESKKKDADIEKKINDIQKYEEEISEKESKLTQAISEKEQILKQLHIVQEQLEHYFIENQEIKKKLPPVLYGAAEQ